MSLPVHPGVTNPAVHRISDSSPPNVIPESTTTYGSPRSGVLPGRGPAWTQRAHYVRGREAYHLFSGGIAERRDGPHS